MEKAQRRDYLQKDTTKNQGLVNVTGYDRKEKKKDLYYIDLL